MQGFDAIARLIQDALEKALSAGIPPRIATQILMTAEAAMVNALCVENSKLLTACREVGTSAVAERMGVTPRTIRRRKQKVLNEKRTQIA